MEAGNFSNFIPLEQGSTIVHRTYSSLTFATQIDSDESELGILDLIQVICDILDGVYGDKIRHFKEADLTFNPHTIHYVIDELIVDGVVCETNKQAVIDTVKQMDDL